MYLIRILGLALAVIAHGLAYLDYQYSSIEALPVVFEDQVAFLLALSLLLAIILPFFRNRSIAWFILIIRYGILLFINRLLGGYLRIEATLATTLIVETFICFSWRSALVYSLVIFALIIINSRLNSIEAWEMFWADTAKRNTLFYWTYTAFIMVYSALLRYQIDNRVTAKELNHRLDEANLQLLQANNQLLQYAAATEQEAVQNERKRFAREIHDILAYTLTNLVVMADAAKDLAYGDREVLLEHLTLTHNQAKEGLMDIRRAIQALRPVQMTKISGLHAVHRLVKAFSKATQINVQLNLGNVPLFFDDEVALIIYRLVQEGMTNALRHGKATEILISFSLINEGIGVLIKDNGIGAGNFKEGFGLMGMRERIERLGGWLKGSNNLEGGFLLSAWMPLRGDQHGKD